MSATATSVTCFASAAFAVAAPFKWDFTSSDNCLLTVYCFIRNFISASGASTVAIDNKIEQAMVVQRLRLAQEFHICKTYYPLAFFPHIHYKKLQLKKDLVKSHLMFAVREEVDVLKEKITELMDRINQLEYENSILKANANQETLAKLARPPASSS